MTERYRSSSNMGQFDFIFLLVLFQTRFWKMEPLIVVKSSDKLDFFRLNAGEIFEKMEHVQYYGSIHYASLIIFFLIVMKSSDKLYKKIIFFYRIRSKFCENVNIQVVWLYNDWNVDSSEIVAKKCIYSRTLPIKADMQRYFREKLPTDWLETLGEAEAIFINITNKYTAHDLPSSMPIYK